MEKNNIALSVRDEITKDFSLQESSLPVSNDLTALREHLVKRIIEMMDSNYERFLNNLYRIDVSEDKVNQTFKKSEPREVPSKLADLIIERQIQRIKTRLLYKEGKL